jgi:hypothetical protein
MCNDLNETVLEAALVGLPALLGLHVVGCPKVDHACLLRLVCHTPLLESLSMATTVRTISFTKIWSLTELLAGVISASPRSTTSASSTSPISFSSLYHVALAHSTGFGISAQPSSTDVSWFSILHSAAIRAQSDGGSCLY